MDFKLEDFVPEVQENIKRYHKWACKDNSTYNGAIATMCNFEENDKVPQITGEWEYISKLIPIFKDMGYDDFHLYYEDCGVWVLKWHSREFDDKQWMLIE